MTKLCPRGKAAAKRKFKVYPSAYANAYASKICAGKIKDPSGTKRKDFKGPKPAGKAVGGVIGKGVIKSANKLRKEGLPFKKLSATGILGATPVGMALKKYQDKQKAKKRDKVKVQKKNTGGMPLKNPYDNGTPVYTKRELRELKQQKRNERKNIRTTPENRRKSPLIIRKNMPIARNKGGDAKIKKVITGLKKASALHKAQAKSLQTVVGKSVGGMADYYKDLM